MSIAGIQGVKISRGMENTPTLHCLGLVFVTVYKMLKSQPLSNSEVLRKSATQYKCFYIVFCPKKKTKKNTTTTTTTVTA